MSPPSNACPTFPTSPNTTTRLATPDTSDTTTRLATPAPDTRLVTWQNERKLVKYKCRGPACVATKHMQASLKHMQSENDRGGTDKLTHRNRLVDSQEPHRNRFSESHNTASNVRRKPESAHDGSTQSAISALSSQEVSAASPSSMPIVRSSSPCTQRRRGSNSTDADPTLSKSPKCVYGGFSNRSLSPDR